MKKIYLVIAFYFFLYLVLIFTTLSINYVEGDDASGILYHLCGRNINIQSPYSCYNSGLDFIVSFIGPNEIVLRNFSVILSFVFGFTTISLLAILIDNLISNISTNSKYYFLALLPFIIPDFIFNSLIINSTNISFSFALLATIFYSSFLKFNKSYYFLMAVIFMALSVPFRWSIIVYYPVFFSVLLLSNDFSLKKSSSKLLSLILFGILSLILGIILIYVSGYNFNKLIETIIWGKKYMDNSEKSIVSTIAIASSFFTAPLLIVLIFGLIAFFRGTKKTLLGKFLFLILPLSPYFVLGLFIAYKYLITVIPILIFICLYGFLETKKYKLIAGTFIFSIIAIWFIGVKIDVNNTLYGSGYGFKTEIPDDNQVINERNLDSRLKFKGISLATDGGFYIPTPEGPRPLFGYFYVIFGGLWKNDIDNLAKNRAFVIKTLQNSKTTILLQDRKTAYLECDLYKFGYKTTSKYKLYPERNLEIRTYTKGKDTITINAIGNNGSKAYFSLAFLKNNPNVIFRSSYSSLIFNVIKHDKNIKNLDAYTIYKHNK